MAEPLLKIETLIERPVIEIDGTRYEILSPDELSIVDSMRFEQWGRRLSEVKAADLKIEDVGEISDILRKLTDWIMVGVPEDVRGKITEAQRLLVADVFTRLFRRKETAAAKSVKPKKASRRIGAKSLRGSRDSTAATPPAG